MSARSVTVRVPAKVNLQLSVGQARPDGFHELVTVFQAVNLCDEIVVRPNPGGGIALTLSGDDAEGLPTDAANLAHQAAEALAAHVGVEPDVAIHVHKAIPVAGGMAGGSADAAGTLVACDALWRSGVPREELSALAADLGSDVPFPLQGGTAIGTGRGENLTSVLSRGTFSWVFALADGGLSTPAVYGECDRLREGRSVPDPYVSDMLMQALAAGDPVLLGISLHNDLQAAASSLRPSLGQVLAAGDDFGALGGIVSGSGPTCAFLARDEEHALDLAVALTSTGLCRTVRRAQGPVPGARITG
ncbi:MAG: 4-(cytidine 5'-diphospho)-2-C-methyl-D-erythritol kinase [Candidatus Nanopelagicales bacterium]|nr:4-(cytidine 5'-diphospho)-2-C-methyl-D-erythritol kinase [Candidatus Nanopelagicales bacterium]MCF8538634.1 4-(cytidine 5'-diphospho)-2-C-methyl-D-erythritol kinase [Candidatus Nanopelagicales bacterium]